MKVAWSRVLLGAAALTAAGPLWRLGAAMPVFGEPTAPLGPAINALGPPLRHVSNMVSAVNFDFRGVDTLGEEFMLLCAVTGAVMLLRGSRGESITDTAGHAPGRAVTPIPEAVTLACRVLGPLIVVFGLYIALHAMTTPGGGFQGGVIVASGLLLAYLGEGYAAWRTRMSSRALGVMEGGGAALFVLAGLVPMVMGRAFLENILPLGTAKVMLSGGLMLVENAGVTLAVTGGFGLLFIEFMEETRERRSADEADPAEDNEQ